MDEDDSEIPVACTLSPDQAEERTEHVIKALASAYLRVEDDQNGLTIVFDGTADTLTAVALFVANELVCCSFADYRIEVSPPFNETHLRIAGPEGTTKLFREGLLPQLKSA
jgi:hypothetical protein